ncbi:carotenoid biosynthesis protein [Pedobacter sp. HMF7647]|uniref:Carotenoid biosynthesis protein n=1 Tax=Hufsiella arboris TaxID=2695275 RepID=A0A7K1Y6V1_9SPHI|nr:carotenoid biosynthesis protein [Hufsiella arboris]MXV50295.1 carotenoid biosynthesis protein [Hufsiella arboris]
MLPYPGIPYGPAPQWCYLLAEFVPYVLLILCLIYACRNSIRDVSYLLGGVLFGLLLEYMEVMMGSYTYGHFRLMLGSAALAVPLWIGVGWGIIMYTARLYTDKLGLTLWPAAAFDTLLALNIDLSMDVVAYRTHMWHWDWSDTDFNPLTAQWFGIPFGNFIGWQTVVFSYSLFSRIFEKKIRWTVRPAIVQSTLTALLSLICSLAALYLTQEIWPYLTEYLGIRSVHRFTGICLILVILTVTGWRKRTAISASLPAIAWLVPFWFHLFFAGCFFILGFFRENWLMTFVTLLNLLTGLLIHYLPLKARKTAKSADLLPS